MVLRLWIIYQANCEFLMFEFFLNEGLISLNCFVLDYNLYHIWQQTIKAFKFQDSEISEKINANIFLFF